MLLQEKIEHTDFSPSERIVIDFIMEKQEFIENYTTTAIAKETYTSPSILIRIAKKLGFSGYNAFKKAFLEEVLYLKHNFHDLDANLPFSSRHSIMDIAAIITNLKQESLRDTLSLIDPGQLQKAVRLLKNAQAIKVFAISNINYLAEEFVFKLRHIGIKAETYLTSTTLFQEAKMSQPNECAICISYSGETPELNYTAKLLNKNRVPIIAITSVGENSLTRLASVVLQTTTREKSYSKIGAFTSLESISALLDILYSCLFQADYKNNYNYKIQLSKATEFRSIDNAIIQED